MWFRFQPGTSFTLLLDCLSYLRNKNSFDLPISHYSPLHCGLHEQANVSFPSSNKQEPPLRHPAIRQPRGKLYISLSIDFLQLFIPGGLCFRQSFSNVEHENSTDKLLVLRSSFFNIYGCLHSILLLTSFSKHVSLLLGKKTLPLVMILGNRKIWEGENMARSHTKHDWNACAFFTTTQLYCFTKFLFFT